MTKRLLMLAFVLGAISSLHSADAKRQAAIFNLAGEYAWGKALPLALTEANKEPTFDINAVNEKGQTALAIACQAGIWPNIIELLVYGANPATRGSLDHFPEAQVFFDAYLEKVALLAAGENTLQARVGIIEQLRSKL